MIPADEGVDHMMSANLGEQLPELSVTAPDMVADPIRMPGLPNAVLRIPVSVQVIIGTVRLPLSQVAQLAPGATLALEEKLGAPSKVLVNGREVAEGDLFVVDVESGRLGLTITRVAGDSPAD
jgi:flagellar motor switch protein FliN/FliY